MTALDLQMLHHAEQSCSSTLVPSVRQMHLHLCFSTAAATALHQSPVLFAGSRAARFVILSTKSIKRTLQLLHYSMPCPVTIKRTQSLAGSYLQRTNVSMTVVAATVASETTCHSSACTAAHLPKKCNIMLDLCLLGWHGAGGHLTRSSLFMIVTSTRFQKYQSIAWPLLRPPDEPQRCISHIVQDSCMP